MYRKCNKCLTVSVYNKSQNFKCSNCNNVDIEQTTKYPIDAAKSFLDAADTNVHDLDDINVQIDLINFEGFETTSLFLCTAYEVLLESLISDYLMLINTPKKVANLLVNSNQGQWKMGKLFSDLIGFKSIKSVFKEINQKEFFTLLQELINTRNAYIHGDHQAFKNSKLKDVHLKYICDSMIGIFVTLHNTYISK